MAVSISRHSARSFSDQEIAELLEAWRLGELGVARRFGECGGLGEDDLEDLYQEAAIELISRPYFSQVHLRNALRAGIKLRALRAHRDRTRRAQILAQAAPGILATEQARRLQQTPDQVVLAYEDRLIAAEFLSELSALEQRVFKLLAEGFGARATAQTLGIAGKEARSASRACERKRDRFVVLYESGRLCGFRAHTIRSLQSGQLDSGELARRAYIHLQGCARCRQEHETSGREFRRLFDSQSAALLPLPALATHGYGLLARAGGVLARHQELVVARVGGGSMREQLVGVVAGASATAKLAAGVATVAVMAGSAVGVEHTLSPRPLHSARHTRPSATGRANPTAAATVATAPAATARVGGIHRGAERQANGSASPRSTSRQTPSKGSQRSAQSGGFGFLGANVASSPRHPRAVAASSTRPASTQPQASGSGHAPGGGGLFSP